MLRIFGLLVASSIAVLVWNVRIPQPAGSGPSAPGQALATEDAPRGGIGPQPTARRPIPTLPDVSSPADVQPDEADEPDEAEEADEPGEVDESDEVDWPHEEDDPPVPSPDPPVEDVPAAEDDYVPTAEDKALARQVLAFFDEFASAVSSNADSCDGMAEALRQLLSRNRDLIATAKALDAQAPPSRWLEKQIEPTVVEMVNRIAVPLQRCAGNERLNSVIQSNFG